MDKILKIVFVKKYDEKTNKKVIVKTVIFREGKKPLVEDYSKEKHILYLIEKMASENHHELREDYITYLTNIGFVEISSMENVEQMDKLKMEIIDAQLNNGISDIDKNYEEKKEEVKKEEEKKVTKDKDKKVIINPVNDDLVDFLNICRLREYNFVNDSAKERLNALLASGDKEILLIEKAYNEYLNSSLTERDAKRRQYIELRDSALRALNEAERNANLKKITKISFKETLEEPKDLDEEAFKKFELKLNEALKSIAEEREELVRQKAAFNLEKENFSKEMTEEKTIEETKETPVVEPVVEGKTSSEENKEVVEVDVPVTKEVNLDELLPRTEEDKISYKGALQLLKAYSIFDEEKINVEYGDRLLVAISKLINTPHKDEAIGSITLGSVPTKEELDEARESLAGLVAKIKDGEILEDSEKTLLLDNVYLLAGIKRGLLRDDEIISRDTYTLRDPGYVDVKVDAEDKVKDEDKVDADLEVNIEDSPVVLAKTTEETKEESKDEEKTIEKSIEETKEEHTEDIVEAKTDDNEIRDGIIEAYNSDDKEEESTEVKTARGRFTFRSCLGWVLGGILAVTGVTLLWNTVKNLFSKGGNSRFSVKDRIEHTQTVYETPSTTQTDTKTPVPVLVTNPTKTPELFKNYARSRSSILTLIKSYNYNLETTHYLESKEEFLSQFTNDAQFKNVCDALAFGYQMNTLMRIDNNFSLPVDKAKMQSFTHDFLCAKAVINGYNAGQLLTLFGRSSITYEELMTGYGNFLNMMTLYNTNAVKRPPVELFMDNPNDVKAINSLYDSLISINKSRLDGVVTSSETDKFIATAYNLYTSESFSTEGVKTFGASLLDGYACMQASQGGLYVYKDTGNVKAGTHILGGTEGGLALVRPDGGTYVIDRIVKSNVSPKAQNAQAILRSNLAGYQSLQRSSDLPLLSNITSGVDSVLGNKAENGVSYLFTSLLENRRNLGSRARYDIEAALPTRQVAPPTPVVEVPTAKPTIPVPTFVPTQKPTQTPTQVPTQTATPTQVPTQTSTPTPTQTPTPKPTIVVERQETTTVEQVEKEEMSPKEQAHVEKVEQLRQQQSEAEKIRKELLVSDLANAYVRGEVTEAEVHARLKEYGIDEDPTFIPRLNEIKKNNAEVERRTEEELNSLNNPSSSYDPEMDSNNGMADEARYEAAFRDTVDGMNGSELLGGKKLVRKI